MWFSGALATYPRLGVLSLRACGGNGDESGRLMSCLNSGTKKEVNFCEAERWSMLALLGVCTLVERSLASGTQHLQFEVAAQLELPLLWSKARGKQSLQQWPRSHLVTVPTVQRFVFMLVVAQLIEVVVDLDVVTEFGKFPPR